MVGSFGSAQWWCDSVARCGGFSGERSFRGEWQLAHMAMLEFLAVEFTLSVGDREGDRFRQGLRVCS